MQRDTDAIAGGQHRAGLGSDGPGRVGEDVLREGDVRPGNPVAKAILQHRLGADGSLFRGLEHGNEGSTPRSPCAGEQVRRAQQAGHVDVVAARMHDAGNATGIVRRGQCRRVGQARALLDGKGVHVGACKDGLSRAIPHDPDGPVRPICSRTSYPSSLSFVAASAAVLVSWKLSSGCAWRSLYTRSCQADTDGRPFRTSLMLGTGDPPHSAEVAASALVTVYSSASFC